MPVPTIFDNFLNSNIYGIPIPIIAIIVAIAFVIYLLATRKPRLKEFKPLDLKKETRRRYNDQFKFFGIKYGKNIYKMNEKKPFGWIVGYMKAVWLEAFKRYEPIHVSYSKGQFQAKLETSSQEVYNMPYSQLNDTQRKNIHELSKEELRDETSHTEKADDKTKIVRGKREIKYSVPIPCFMMKITTPSFLYKLLARFSNIGTNWFVFDADQLDFNSDKLMVVGDFQCETFNNVFIFSKAGKNIVQDIAFGIERENVLQETANQIPRVIHFDMEASKRAVFMREQANIEKDRYKATKEANE